MSEILESFGLPPSFPIECVPAPVHQWVLDHLGRGESLAALIESAKANGFDPIVKPLPQVGPRVYGFGLTFDSSLVVTLMVMMKEAP
jgi:hypothetical protein